MYNDQARLGLIPGCYREREMRRDMKNWRWGDERCEPAVLEVADHFYNKAKYLFSYIKNHLLCLSALLLSWDHAVDGFSLLKLLLHFNHQLDAVDHQLDLIHLGGAQTVGVGDVKHAAHGGRVHAT